MNTYVAIYRHQRITVEAESQYGAQLAAGKHFKVPASKTYRIVVVLHSLADKSPVVHSTASI